MLSVQRRLASQILKCGKNRIRFDPDRVDEIKEAITKSDIKSLIGTGVISKRRKLSTSRFWAKKRKEQKIKSKQKGQGSRKGKKTARTKPKRVWINKIRLQRGLLKSLRDSGTITTTDYHDLYLKSKGGFFRSLRHIKLHVTENALKK